jgi:hypothetical protein
MASYKPMNPQERYPRFSANRIGNARLVLTFLAGLLVVGPSTPVRAAGEKPDPSGTWKWSFARQNGDTMNLSAKLKLDGDKLTGTYVGPRGDQTPITKGQFKDGTLAFTVVREFNGNSFSLKYTGKVTGDTLKGKIEFERDGETRTRDWEAKRAGAVASATGLWKWTITTPDGQTFEPKLRLKQAGQKLTGASIWGDNETPITEGTIEDGAVLVKVLSDRDGRQVTTVFRGKLSGDTLKGTWESDWSGQKQTRDWKATRAKE